MQNYMYSVDNNIHNIGFKMERTQIYFTKKEKEFFKEEARELGIPMAELIRRVLDNYIEKNEKMQ